MKRVDTATAVAQKPAYATGGTPGYFFNGDPVQGLPPTMPGQDWFNRVQEEIANVITAAGLNLDPTNDSQMAQAITALIASSAYAPSAASETVSGILKLATQAQALAGTDNATAMTPAQVAAAAAGVVRAYTRQQYAAPVVRTGQSGSQAVDCDLDQCLSITATGAIALAAPEHLAVGKSVNIQVYAASALAITYDAAYSANASFALPAETRAGKWIVLSFYCHKPGSMLLTGLAEEA
jgi:hypothetical protein